MGEHNLQLRIEELESHIELGKKLESIVEDPKGIESIKIVLDSLNVFLICYKKEIKSLEDYQRLVQEQKEYRESWLSKYSHLYSRREEAEESYDKPTKNPRRTARIKSVEAFLYGNLAWLSAPFSRETSKYFLERRKQCQRCAKEYIRLDKAMKENERMKSRNISLTHRKEFAEAKTAKALEEIGADDKIVYEVLQKPEIIMYKLLEAIKDKYVPWL